MESLHKALPSSVRNNPELLQKIEQAAQEAKAWADNADERRRHAHDKADAYKAVLDDMDRLTASIARLCELHSGEAAAVVLERKGVPTLEYLAGLAELGPHFRITIESWSGRLTAILGEETFIIENYSDKTHLFSSQVQKITGRPSADYECSVELDLRRLLLQYGITNKADIDITLETVFEYAGLTRPSEITIWRYKKHEKEMFDRLVETLVELRSRKTD